STGSSDENLTVNAGTLTVGGNITLTNGGGSRKATLTLTTGTVNLANTISGTGTLAGGTGTFNFDGTTAQTIPVSTFNFSSVAVNNAAGVTPDANVTSSNVTGNLSV